MNFKNILTVMTLLITTFASAQKTMNKEIRGCEIFISSVKTFRGNGEAGICLSFKLIDEIKNNLVSIDFYGEMHASTTIGPWDEYDFHMVKYNANNPHHTYHNHHLACFFISSGPLEISDRSFKGVLGFHLKDGTTYWMRNPNDEDFVLDYNGYRIQTEFANGHNWISTLPDHMYYYNKYRCF